MPTVRLPIGRDEIVFELPLPLQETHTEEEHVKRRTADEALEQCIGSPRLEELSEGVSKIAVVVPDATRAWQRVPLMAEPVRRRLAQCGVESVDWVIGGGQHRLPTDEEIELILSSAPSSNDRILPHDAFKAVPLSRKTTAGTPVELHPAVAEAELVVVLGGITHHDLAGYSGGRKGIIPGVAGRRSTQHNHGLAFLGTGIHPGVRCGSLDENPIHRDMMEFVRTALEGKKSFLLNVIGDKEGRPATYVAGSIEEAWAKGIEEAEALQGLYIDEPADLVIVSSGGYPFDIDLYQAVKAVSATYGAVRPGGGLILVADLPEGLGYPDFGTTLVKAMDDFGSALEEVRQNFTIPPFIALKTVKNLVELNSALVTPKTDIEYPGMVTRSLDEAFRRIAKEVKPKKAVVIPSGNSIALKVRA